MSGKDVAGEITNTTRNEKDKVEDKDKDKDKDKVEDEEKMLRISRVKSSTQRQNEKQSEPGIRGVHEISGLAGSGED